MTRRLRIDCKNVKGSGRDLYEDTIPEIAFRNRGNLGIHHYDS